MWKPRIFRPPVYQGRSHPRKYFEGWYYKFVGPGGKEIWSVIPGVSYSTDSHAFVQVIHANTGRTWYCRYKLGEFSASRKELSVRVGPNHFTDKSVHLELLVEDLELKGEIGLEDTQPFPASLASPGIMGWYSYAPLMECYHGVVSMHHGLSGQLHANGKGISLQGGRGYVEKDWGRSMPSDWIWIQSNHFQDHDDVSLMISLARIPWLSSHFPGFLSFLKVGDRLFRFATYNRSRVSELEISKEKLSLVLENKKFSLQVEVLRQDGGRLKAPRHGAMEREITESIISEVFIKLESRDGEQIFQGKGQYAGLEIVGDPASYFRNND